MRTECGRRALSFEGDEFAIARPSVRRNAEGYTMWACARTRNRPYRLIAAQSADGSRGGGRRSLPISRLRTVVVLSPDANGRIAVQNARDQAMTPQTVVLRTERSKLAASLPNPASTPPLPPEQSGALAASAPPQPEFRRAFASRHTSIAGRRPPSPVAPDQPEQSPAAPP
jgi:hypothetical protein